jgi:hypothetical protein
MILIAADRWVESALASVALDEAVEVKRAPNVVVLSKDVSVVPSPRPGPSLLLMGNSHTYALPGLTKGASMRNDPGDTLVDRLAAELTREHFDRENATFYRASNPNLLPFEMLTRVAWLHERGLVPRVWVVGLTWRNVARDTALRREYRRPYADARFVEGLSAAVAEPAVLDAIRAAQREEQEAVEADRLRGWADRADEVLQARVGQTVALIGRSPEIRARVYGRFAHVIDSVLLGEKTGTHAYELVPADLEFNRACLKAFVRLAHAWGARLVIYLAPERADLPPLMAVEPQAQFNAELRELLDAQGDVLVDARQAVEPRYWGWELETPDRSHFTEPGHAALAKVIASAPQAQTVWEALRSP